jgi:hypothetical protein
VNYPASWPNGYRPEADPKRAWHDHIETREADTFGVFSIQSFSSDFLPRMLAKLNRPPHPNGSCLSQKDQPLPS